MEPVDLENWPNHPTSGELWLHVADIAGAEEFNPDYGLYDNLRPDGETRPFDHGGESVIDVAVPLRAATSPPGVLFVAVMLALVPFVARCVARPIERLTGIAVAVHREGLAEAEPHPGQRPDRRSAPRR